MADLPPKPDYSKEGQSSAEKVMGTDPPVSNWKVRHIQNIPGNLPASNQIQIDEAPDEINKSSQEKRDVIITNSEGKKNSSNVGRIVLFFFEFTVVAIGIYFFINFRSDATNSGGVKISSPLSPELNDQYMPVWEQLFVEKNNIDEAYFKAHIFPKEVGLKNTQLGEQYYINYFYKVDRVYIPLADGIIIKPAGEDHYYSLEELKNAANAGVSNHPEVQEMAGGLFFQINTIVEADKIISKKDADEKLKTCDPNLKAAPNPFSFDHFISKDTYETRLLYSGMLVKSDKTILGNVDLITGEVDCSEAAPLM